MRCRERLPTFKKRTSRKRDFNELRLLAFSIFAAFVCNLRALWAGWARMQSHQNKNQGSEVRDKLKERIPGVVSYTSPRSIVGEQGVRRSDSRTLFQRVAYSYRNASIQTSHLRSMRPCDNAEV